MKFWKRELLLSEETILKVFQNMAIRKTFGFSKDEVDNLGYYIMLGR